MLDYSKARVQGEIAPAIIRHMFTADPSAHVFNGKLYIYPSHDKAHDGSSNDNGDQYQMEDYHVFSMESPDGPVTDHGMVLHEKDVPWVSERMWAPDAATKNGKYYLYFPARDKDGIWRIGAAVADKPEGPFTPEADYIQGTYSIDPAVFVDTDNEAYLYVGGLWGGQLEKWESGSFDPTVGNFQGEKGKKQFAPLVAKLNDDMVSLAEPLKDLLIVDEAGEVLDSTHEHRFFEAAWLHTYKGKYYFSYSTGDTHCIAYAIGDSPYGPFTYKGVVLNPVIGWTNHHSIVEWQGKWYIFYHDCSLPESAGTNHKRSVKFAEITYNPDGTIQTLDPYPNA